MPELSNTDIEEVMKAKILVAVAMAADVVKDMCQPFEHRISMMYKPSRTVVALRASAAGLIAMIRIAQVVTTRQAADVCGLTPAMITNYANIGIIDRSPEGKVTLGGVVQGILSHLRQIRRAKTTLTNASKENVSFRLSTSCHAPTVMM